MQIFLFGSSLISATPNDVDILIVYPMSRSAQSALDYRAKLLAKLMKYVSLPIHAILLSEKEESEIEFIAQENCRLLTRSDIRKLSKLGRAGILK